MLDARTVAVSLLRLGTLPFVAHPVAVSTGLIAPPYVEPAHIALCVHASTIIAFIGGLQQSAAVADDEPAPAALGIVVAIAGSGALLSTALRGATPLEPAILAVAFACQLSIEARLVRPSTASAMLCAERRLPMWIAVAALLAASAHAVPPESPNSLVPVIVSAAAIAPDLMTRRLR
jgi:hypothetical protein